MIQPSECLGLLFLDFSLSSFYCGASRDEIINAACFGGGCSPLSLIWMSVFWISCRQALKTCFYPTVVHFSESFHVGHIGGKGCRGFSNNNLKNICFFGGKVLQCSLPLLSSFVFCSGPQILHCLNQDGSPGSWTETKRKTAIDTIHAHEICRLQFYGTSQGIFVLLWPKASFSAIFSLDKGHTSIYNFQY